MFETFIGTLSGESRTKNIVKGHVYFENFGIGSIYVNKISNLNEHPEIQISKMPFSYVLIVIPDDTTTGATVAVTVVGVGVVLMADVTVEADVVKADVVSCPGLVDLMAAMVGPMVVPLVFVPIIAVVIVVGTAAAPA